MRILNKKLKTLRKESKKTQKEIAISLGITEQFYQSLEYGTKSPSIDTLAKIADYYKLPADYLLENGIFEFWDLVIEHKDTILKQMEKDFSKVNTGLNFIIDYNSLSALSERRFMYAMNALLKAVVLKDGILHIVYNTD